MDFPVSSKPAAEVIARFSRALDIELPTRVSIEAAEQDGYSDEDEYERPELNS